MLDTDGRVAESSMVVKSIMLLTVAWRLKKNTGMED